MTFKQADKGKSNPLFSMFKDNEYNVNCPLAVLANELRRRGFNVEAKGFMNKGWALELSNKPEKAWLSKTGNIPSPKKILGYQRFDKDKGKLVVLSKQMLQSEIDELTQTKGRYFIYYKPKKQMGHIICMERNAKNELLFFDPQSGDVLKWLPEKFKKIDMNFGIHVMRIDDLRINPHGLKEVLNVIN